LLSGTLFKAPPSLTTSIEFATTASLPSGVIARLVGGPKTEFWSDRLRRYVAWRDRGYR
jgi:hypothetical protein